MIGTSIGEDRLVSVAVPRPTHQLFSYRVPSLLVKDLSPGQWVKVPFGKAQLYGFVVKPSESLQSLPEGVALERIRSVLEVGSPKDLVPAEILNLCHWISRYYRIPLGEILGAAASPAAMGLKLKKEVHLSVRELPEPKDLVLNLEQAQALHILQSSPLPVGLLHGVTGSGKTEVYMVWAKEVLRQGKGVLFLVPEIALTHQLKARLESALGFEVGLWHSVQPATERRRLWRSLMDGKMRCVVGARSALFAPIQNLGLILVDEEHDPSFKQEERARYNARDLAMVRGRMSGARVVLGSATPSFESLHNARTGKYSFAEIKQRYSDATRPTIEVLSLQDEAWVPDLRFPLAVKSVEALKKCMSDGHQALIFLNRRGYAPFLLCEDCGTVPKCDQCSISLTFYRGRSRMRCHLCAKESVIPLTCDHCQGHRLVPMGVGTEGLEDDFQKLLPGVVIDRLDRDRVTSSKRLETLLDDFRSGKTQVLVGTQMLVKGHDFPKVTLVLVILADGLFQWPDFRANERAYQVLEQVAGRSGRSVDSGRVLIQTYAPDHPVLKVLQGEESFDSFYDQEMELRKALRYPPFGRLVRIRMENKDSLTARKRLEELSVLVSKQEAMALGPSQSAIERVKGLYRWDLYIKADRIEALQRVLERLEQAAEKNSWPMSIDVDPMNFG